MQNAALVYTDIDTTYTRDIDMTTTKQCPACLEHKPQDLWYTNFTSKFFTRGTKCGECIETKRPVAPNDTSAAQKEEAEGKRPNIPTAKPIKPVKKPTPTKSSSKKTVSKTKKTTAPPKDGK